MTCQRCGADSEGYLCWRRCVMDLRRLLGELVEMLPELDIQIAKMDVGAPEPTSNGGLRGSPLNYNPRAAEVRDVVLDTLESWSGEKTPGVRGKSASQGAYIGGRLRADAAEIALNWPDAAQFVDEIEHAYRLVLRCVDRRIPAMEMGQCECGSVLSARSGQRIVRCHQCERVHDIEPVRRKAEQRASDSLVTAKQAATVLGLDPRLINQWARRGHITRHSKFGREWRYRFGEIRQRLDEESDAPHGGGR